MNKNIVVTQYNSDWPKIFEDEASNIRKALGDTFLTLWGYQIHTRGPLITKTIFIYASIKALE